MSANPSPHAAGGLSTPLHVLVGVLALLLAVFPLLPEAIATPYNLGLLTQMMILAIFAMSLDLLLGVTGLVSLGHAGFFGLAGYVLALVMPQTEPVSLFWSLPLAVAVSALAALLIGFLVVRTHGIYFIMVTLAFSQMLFFIFHDNKPLGGSDGLYVNFKPTVTVGGVELLNLDHKATLYWFTWAAFVAVYVFLRRLLASPFGRALSGIKVNDHRMRAMGFGTFGYKLAAFTLGGALAGLAGYLWGVKTGYINPELMGFHLSAHAIMMVILGGFGHIAGAAMGAFAFEYLIHLYKDLTKHWQLLMGGTIVLLVLFAPRGILGLLQSGLARLGNRKP
jgi:branched-chain amino acid transport system permease protein